MSNKYSAKFNSHVRRFMQEFKLLPVSGKVFVAVSGGVDSMALLQFFLELKKQNVVNEIEVVHVNHGLRKASDREAQFLIHFCQENDLIINYMCLIKPKKMVNVEAWARESRYNFFHQVCGEGDALATAHHLDDSFEWWLMNRLKGSTNTILGIPARNGLIIRPFLAVTKKQIKHYAKVEKLTSFEDESNLDNRFERNFIRNIIVPQMQTRYPKMLKHYALRSLRDLASQKKNEILNQTKVINFEWGSHFFYPLNSPPETAELLTSLKKISTVERGLLSKELFKLRSAIQNGKTGPMSFSGGVKVYFNRSELLMINKKGLDFFSELDQVLLSKLSKKQLKQTYTVESFLKLRKRGKLHFPSLVMSDDKILQRAVPSIRQELQIFPQLTRFLIKNNVWFCSGNHLEHLVVKKPALLKRQLVIINLQDWPQGFKIP